MEVAAQALFALIGVALLTQVADGTEMLSWATYEWEPLEEVIVGRLDGAVVPPNHVSVTYNRPHSTSWLHRLAVVRRYPQWMVRRAQSPFAGAFQCATLDTRRHGALADYF
jgi:hypothetical protein